MRNKQLGITSTRMLEQAGVTGFHHQPVTARDIQKHDVETFRQLIGQAEYPVLAYCRTGHNSRRSHQSSGAGGL
ncbi:hypothetical protein NM2005040_1627 [Neisseria meningitidis 2005040]|nr:hypothetical protein NM2005040_1627 [Neisseria meningitidis 2005040]